MDAVSYEDGIKQVFYVLSNRLRELVDRNSERYLGWINREATPQFQEEYISAFRQVFDPDMTAHIEASIRIVARLMTENLTVHGVRDHDRMDTVLRCQLDNMYLWCRDLSDSMEPSRPTADFFSMW